MQLSSTIYLKYFPQQFSHSFVEIQMWNEQNRWSKRWPILIFCVECERRRKSAKVMFNLQQNELLMIYDLNEKTFEQHHSMTPLNWTKFFCLIQVDETLKKKRAFRKFTYRGVDLDQLLDMPKWVKVHTQIAHQTQTISGGLNLILMRFYSFFFFLLCHLLLATNW